ncbi:Zn-ribbon domain-containing OB-fold protein [Nocardia sp. NBC_00416]|uniref:Zn-ribbon domain-containing OB-fold protein n=1 Tax=Nocardia sp. NBC_00416 TaxID=2975991 RepID=UPI002E209F40
MTPQHGRPEPARGMYEDEFWNFVQKSDLRLQRAASGRLRYPPAAVDPETLDPEYEWIPIQGTGKLIAWTVFHRQYFPEFPTPYTVGAVQIDEGPILYANIIGVAPKQNLYHGMPMTVTYEPTASAGREWTIFQWRPTSSVETEP